MIRALIFDLDDTLYREMDFVESGYRAVARYVSERTGRDFHTLYRMMVDTLHTGGRYRVLCAVKEKCPADSIAIKDMVSVYRRHSPEIRLYPGYAGLLKALSERYRMGIITDGIPEVQERKVRALRLEGLMDRILYTWKYGEEKQKPHPHSFRLMLRWLEIPAENALYVGDNPMKDCAGASGAGMKFAQISPPARDAEKEKNAPGRKPEYVIKSLFQLPPLLQELI
ncbi:MAG: HAD family hydrolase [Acidobacteria bacterium]|nr:HAD family hydrolase [Acidobacteriota bacterium]